MQPFGSAAMNAQKVVGPGQLTLLSPKQNEVRNLCCSTFHQKSDDCHVHLVTTISNEGSLIRMRMADVLIDNRLVQILSEGLRVLRYRIWYRLEPPLWCHS